MNSGGAAESAEETKRKRLEAWRRKQQQQQQQHAAPPVKKVAISLSLSGASNQKKKKKSAAPVLPAGKKKKKKPIQSFFGDADSDDDGGSNDINSSGRRKRPLDLFLGEDKDSSAGPATTTSSMATAKAETEPSEKRSKKKQKTSSRWDAAPKAAEPSPAAPPPGIDALDQFMEKLEAGALTSSHVTATSNQQAAAPADTTSVLQVHVGGSMMRRSVVAKPHPVSGGVITALELEQRSYRTTAATTIEANPDSDQPLYQPSDWLSDAAADTDDEKEEEQEARRALIEALKSTPGPADVTADDDEDEAVARPAQLISEVKSEKHRREERLKQLEHQAEEARQSALAGPEFGVMYNDTEDGVMEEAERNLQAAKAAPDALLVLAELNKKKELKAVDHSQVDYPPIQKNLYRVPTSLAELNNDEVVNRRAKLKVRVRGHGAPAPVDTFEQCGLSEKILQILAQQDIHKPYPVQAQCIPCIMAGRDVIGIAETGSGKTLAYVLPMLRHILVQPPLEQNESGPIGLILAPARELAYQIHIVCRSFGKQLGIKSTAVYGGAGVAEQIGSLKRGSHIVVATPGRLIDILTMQSGKILSLHRVTFVVMDEADRMFDMGFAPQISAVLAAVRPDRQTVLFSATFPKAVETLARKSQKFPLEVIVGGRSVASGNITQYAELVESNDKFLRLLQLLGEQVEGTKKVLIFVDTQVRADSIFEQLLRNGYPSLSLHGGKEQEDRDSTISDFKRKDGPNVLVATGVAGRGLDVPACTCVINYSAPNHLEAYIHQVGRTGRAGKRGVAYTFVNSAEESKFAPSVVRALSESGMAENISPELKQLSDDFKAKVEKGEARYAGSGFKGKGYTYDSTEMSDAQKLAKIEKRQALIEAGLLDPDDEEDTLMAEMMASESANNPTTTEKKEKESGERAEAKSVAAVEVPANLTPELLALPGMKEALLAKAGIKPATVATNEAVSNDPLDGPVQLAPNHYLQELEINDYPQKARWKVTQKETTSRLQDEFKTAVTLKGLYFGPGKEPAEGERKLYLHLEAQSEQILKNAVAEIQRMLNEETLRAGMGGTSSHKYNVL